MEIKIINKMEDVVEGLNCYQFDGINFLLNLKKKTKRLIVFFHGLVYPNENIFFAKTKWGIYDITDETISVLSINDKVLEENRYLITSAFHETKNIRCHEKYKEIINKIIDIVSPKKTIFMGVSIGAFSAIYFGSLLSINKKSEIIIVCFNSYLYINDLYQKSNKKFRNDDNVIEISIQDTITKSNIDDIYFYINRNDNVFFKDTTRFILFAKKNTKYNPKYIVFDSVSRYNNGHSTFLPYCATFESIIDSL
jgi:hypothetical protein